MTPEDFLKEKGIIKEGYSKWICIFEDGKEFNVGDLIQEYNDRLKSALREAIENRINQIAPYCDGYQIDGLNDALTLIEQVTPKK